MATNNTALGHRGAILIGKESTFGTEVSRDTSIACLSESLASDENLYVSGAMRSDHTNRVAARGHHSASGGLTLEPNGNNLGKILQGVLRQHSTATLDGSVTGAPGASNGGSGATLAAGGYYYVVVSVLQKAGWANRLTSPSPVSSQVTVAAGEEVTVSWTNPTTFPDGWSLLGMAIYRTATDAASGTETFLAYQAGAGTSYVDDGSVALSSDALPSDVYSHAFDDGATGTIPSWSVEVAKDNGSSHLYLGSVINEWSFEASPDGPCSSSVALLCRQELEEETPTTPSFPDVGPLMGHGAQLSVGADIAGLAAKTIATAFSVSVSNGATVKHSLDGSRLARTIKAGISAVSFDYSIDYEDADEFDEYVQGNERAVRLLVEWPTTGTAQDLGGGVEASPWPYALQITLPKVRYSSSASNVSAGSLILQNFSGTALKDATEGYSIEAELINLTSSYS